MSNLEIAITALDGVNPGKGSDLTYRKLEKMVVLIEL